MSNKNGRPMNSKTCSETLITDAKTSAAPLEDVLDDFETSHEDALAELDELETTRLKP